MPSDASPSALQELLDRWHGGDDGVRNELFSGAQESLLRLTRKLMVRFHRVRDWLQSDDVLQEAQLRLLTALAGLKNRPRTEDEFLGLAARQIRWELLDIIRRLYGPTGMGTRVVNLDPAAVAEPIDESESPEAVAALREFVASLDQLPERQRQAIELKDFNGYSEEAAARVMGLTRHSFKRLLIQARQSLARHYRGEWPF